MACCRRTNPVQFFDRDISADSIYSTTDTTTTDATADTTAASNVTATFNTNVADANSIVNTYTENQYTDESADGTLEFSTADSISCPCANNNLGCYQSLRDAVTTLVNQKVCVHTSGRKMCVIIMTVGNEFVKAYNVKSQKIVYINVNKIENIGDILPTA